jgi:hypothetical protein
MGHGRFDNRTPDEKRADAEFWRKRALDASAALQAQRMALADKITMVIVDEVAGAIIRPGPKPEERECYVMAQELRDHAARIKELVAAVLAVDAGET